MILMLTTTLPFTPTFIIPRYMFSFFVFLPFTCLMLQLELVASRYTPPYTHHHHTHTHTHTDVGTREHEQKT